MKLNGRILTTLAMLGVFLAFVVRALFFHPEARMMPLLVGVPGILLCSWQLLTEINAKDSEAGGSKILSRGELTIAAWLLAFIISIAALGFSFGSPPLVAGYLYFVAKERLHTALIAGIFCFAFMYGLFERLMNMQLFEGLLLQYLW
jgi:tripartite tricarboxylate transporter TctB family protein